MGLVMIQSSSSWAGCHSGSLQRHIAAVLADQRPTMNWSLRERVVSWPLIIGRRTGLAHVSKRDIQPVLQTMHGRLTRIEMRPDFHVLLRPPLS